MMVPAIRVGTRSQKVSQSKKVYKVIATVSCSYQPPHVQLASETDHTDVITISAVTLHDSQFWRMAD